MQIQYINQQANNNDKAEITLRMIILKLFFTFFWLFSMLYEKKILRYCNFIFLSIRIKILTNNFITNLVIFIFFEKMKSWSAKSN